MAGYVPLLVMIILATGFCVVNVVGLGMLQPKRPTAAKEAPYESGIVPRRASAERFPVRFYLVAMIFIIFDIEIIFTYPWAVIYNVDLGKYGLVEMAVFTIAVFVSLLYLVANGGLDWGPVRRVANLRAPAQPERTVASTVRRTAAHKDPAASSEVAERP